MPPSPIDPDRLLQNLDPIAVGRSIFGMDLAQPVPEIPGYSALTYLAEGGFGTVWGATREADGSRVALKIPHRTDPETSERLEAEAGALRALKHPHIVRLLALESTASGDPALAMELVDGPPLTVVLPEHGFGLEKTLQILLPVLEAVAHAHSHGIIHRDLKPSNILLEGGVTPKVSDFGLAHSVPDQRVAFCLTRSGVVAGTVEYLAPEAYLPHTEPAATTDIYALGVILYEMLTGHPPRGAWPPLSQVKPLDVRLDALLADAIHPDPAKRLVSATAFRHRLAEIRDSRPRLAGTPLATRPVRAADAAWTVLGLYALAAGYCSLLSINNTDVPAMFDLRLGHTFLLGGFWALWILTLVMGIVWSWQAVRLWRFRHVPLREALPSPFGIRLGTSGGAARLVALAQILCAWAPLAYIGWIYSQVWFWATPDSASWENVLAVTRWGSDEPVSPWTWHPAGMVSGDEFWIREMRPGFVDRTWQLLDRQSFLVVTQPLAMAAAAAGIAAGIATTLATTTRRWARCHRRPLFLLLLALTALASAVYQPVSEEIQSRSANRGNIDLQQNRKIEALERTAKPVIYLVFNSVYGRGGFDPASLTAAFAPEVTISGGTVIERRELIDRLFEEHQQGTTLNRSISAFREHPMPADPAYLERRLEFELYTDPPGQPSTGEFATLTCQNLHPGSSPPREIITGWASDLQPLYSARPRPLEPLEAITWCRTFLAALQETGSPSLETFFLPTILAPPAGDLHGDIPTPRGVLTSALRTGIAVSGDTVLRASSLPALTPLPGARWRATVEILQTAPRRPRALRWTFDLVPADTGWQALRLELGATPTP